MENASKALIIAGSVLISLLVISLLVFGYTNLKKYMEANQTVEASEQVSEFNKQYDVYYRNNIYGSELLSLTNKIVDYNKKYREDDGYTRLEMGVTFTDDIKAMNEYIVKKNNPYNSNDLKAIVTELENNIQKYVKQEKIAGKSISSLSGYRTTELKEIVGESNLSNAQNKISMYLGYKTALTQIKSLTFRAEKFDYDNTNGRITLMHFREN